MHSLLPLHVRAGKIHWRNTLEQLNIVGPKSLSVCLLTSFFLGMVFTIQFIRHASRAVAADVLHPASRIPLPALCPSLRGSSPPLPRTQQHAPHRHPSAGSSRGWA